MKTQEYMPPIYILSFVDAQEQGIAHGRLAHLSVEKLGFPPCPVVIVDPLKLERVRIYSELNIAAVRILVNTYLREMVVSPGLMKEIRERLSRCVHGTGSDASSLKRYPNKPYELAYFNLTELSLGLSSKGLKTSLMRDFWFTEERQGFPIQIPVLPELHGMRIKAVSFAEQEHLKLIQRASTSLASSSFPRHFSWEFVYKPEEVQWYRDYFESVHGATIFFK